MQDLFKSAQNFIKSLPQKPQKGQPEISNEDKLSFYALFKQASTGPNSTSQPSRFKIVEKYKWDAWKKLGKMSKEQAMNKYVESLTKIYPKWQKQVKPKL